MRVAYTRRARELIERAARWWAAHREGSPGLLFAELDDAIDLLEASPGIGSPYRTRQGDLVRRVLLPRTSYYLYYVVDADAELVLVVSVWSSSRRRGPSLP